MLSRKFISLFIITFSLFYFVEVVNCQMPAGTSDPAMVPGNERPQKRPLGDRKAGGQSPPALNNQQPPMPLPQQQPQPQTQNAGQAIAQSPPAPSAAPLPDPSQTSSSDTKPTAQHKNSPTETAKSSGLRNSNAGSPSRENPNTSNGSRFERGHCLIAIYSMIVGLFAVMAAMMLL